MIQIERLDKEHPNSYSLDELKQIVHAREIIISKDYERKDIVKSIIKNIKHSEILKVPSNFRFGYACISVFLRERNIFTSRTVRLQTYKSKGIEYVKDLGIQNLKDLLTILKWNKLQGIYFMRLSSEIFPFASHPEYGYSLDFANDLLKEIGHYAIENNMRLTMHPGQYNVLSSPNESIIQKTILDLRMHAEIFDRMGLDQNSVLVIHGGGIYGNKPKALERLKTNLLNLPEHIRNRMVLENCEMNYTVSDLLEISESCLIPIVIDFHHDQIHPSPQPVEYYFDRVFKIWKQRNIKPKVHVSNSIPGILETDSKTKKRKHSDYIEFIHAPLLSIDFPIDVMLECKMKEKALKRMKFVFGNKNIDILNRLLKQNK